MAGEVDAAVNAGKGIAGKVANLFNPRAGGHLGKTSVVLGALAFTGFMAATGGAALPFATAATAAPTSTTVAAGEVAKTFLAHTGNGMSVAKDALMGFDWSGAWDTLNAAPAGA